tara:strand:- start:2248 stop:3105 length:858 start_codon:yes stop_codon:yes gene_type:complete
MAIKKISLYLNIIYLTIIILILLISYYLYLIYNKKKKKIENFDVIVEYRDVTFYDEKETTEFLLRDSDNYVRNFTIYDLMARKVDSKDEYIKKISQCSKNFSQQQKDIIKTACSQADNFFSNYNNILNGKEISKIPWVFCLTYNNNYEYENGFPHTRENIIFIPDKIIPNTVTIDLVNTLIHEKIHVYQRYNKDIMDVILNNMGYEITTEYNPKKRANPDLDYNTYYDRNKGVLLQCYYNSDRPNSISDVTCTDNNNIYEHPYELIAYKIANEYNSKILENYINI